MGRPGLGRLSQNNFRAAEARVVGGASVQRVGRGLSQHLNGIRPHMFLERAMSVRRKAILALLLGFLNALGSFMLIQSVSGVFILEFLAGTMLFGWYVQRLRCQNCGMRACNNDLHIFGCNT